MENNSKMLMTYIVESVGIVIAYRDTLGDACDFAKHYSDKGTMMGVQVWQKPDQGEREYICSFVDGRRWDSATPRDIRYEYVICLQCRQEWQRIDWGCARHQLTCSYPLPPIETASLRRAK